MTSNKIAARTVFAMALLTSAPTINAEDSPAAPPAAVFHVDSASIDWQPVTGTPFPDGLERRALHTNERIGGGAAMLRFPKGYVEPRHFHTTAGHSVYILKGRIKVAGEAVGPGHFFYAPPNVAHGPNEALEDTEILIWTDGPLDLHLGDPATGDPEAG